MKRAKITLALLSIVIAVACAPRQMYAQTANKLVKTFFVGAEGSQYFIKPLTFEGEGKQTMQIDFTFRCRNVIGQDTVKCNFTIASEKIYKHLDSMTIVSSAGKAVCSDVQLLFNKTEGKKFLSRLSADTMLADLDKAMAADDWTICLYRDGVCDRFHAPAKTRKQLRQLNQRLFIIFK